MELNEIKKALYKRNPTAWFVKADKEKIIYETAVGISDNLTDVNTITFFVPLSDIGDASFEAEMPAKLLIRYII